MIGTRFYPLKEVKRNKAGLWYVYRSLLSKAQLESLTVVINQEVQVIKGEDVPF